MIDISWMEHTSMTRYNSPVPVNQKPEKTMIQSGRFIRCNEEKNTLKAASQIYFGKRWHTITKYSKRLVCLLQRGEENTQSG